jgi:YVTN family beta-propeller protein
MARGQGSSGASQRFLATVLFTDIVGSTERAVALGDRAWRDLLEQHHAMVREELQRYGGREIDTAGDGFFAAFALPAQAVACARAIADRIHGELGIDIRAGLHMGECEVHGDKIGGIAVHIGARVASKAGGAEVLVTNTIRDLVYGSGVQFEDRGTVELKGVPGEWHLFAVTDASAVEPSPDTAARGRSALSDLPLPHSHPHARTRTRSRTRTQLIAAVVALALVTGSAVVLLTRGGTTETLKAINANSLGRIDPRTGDLVDQVAVGTRPTGVAFGAGSLWITSESDSNVARVDPEQGRRTQTIDVGSDPIAVAADDADIWVANAGDGTVSRINAGANKVVVTIPVGNAPSAITIGGGYVWVANTGSATVSRIDPQGGDPTTFPVPDHPAGLVFAYGTLWVSSQTDKTVTRLDPGNGSAQQTIAVGNGASAMAAGLGAVWVTNALDGTVTRIDAASNANAATIPVGSGPDAIVVAGGTVWVSDRFGDEVVGLDAHGTQITRHVAIRNSPRGIVVAAGSLWVAASGSPTGQHRGGTLTIGSRIPLDFIDPGKTYSVEGWSLLSTTNDGLVTYERVAGTEGGTLVPDLAVAIPTPSDGGTTYTFQLRPDIPYSTGGPVRASDLRASLERAFAIGVPRPDFYTGIVGGDACNAHPKTCDLSKGIVTNDQAGTVTFHLTAPDPEFLYKLALPFAWALPADTPRTVATKPLPATGPYRITEYTKSKTLVLERNPKFREWSAAAQPDGLPDRIVLHMGLSDEEQTDQVLSGRLDFMYSSPPEERLAELRTQLPSQVHTFVQDATSYYFLNTRVPPFDSLDARRAVNFALDRKAVGDPFGGEASPTCQAVPPPVPGFHRYCPYTVSPNTDGTWTAPDLATARRLVRRSGTAGTHVTLWTPTFGEAASQKVAALLRTLGYPTTLKIVKNPQAFFSVIADSTKNIQIAPNGWLGDYPAASVFLDGLLSCRAFLPNSPNNLNPGGFCDPQLDAAVQKAEGLQLSNPAAAIEAWAKADRISTDAAPWLFVDNPLGVDLVSKRVGGYARHPVWSVLVDQLWVR